MWLITDESPLFPIRMSGHVWVHGDSLAKKAIVVAPSDKLATKSLGKHSLTDSTKHAVTEILNTGTLLATICLSEDRIFPVIPFVILRVSIKIHLQNCII